MFDAIHEVLEAVRTDVGYVWLSEQAIHDQARLCLDLRGIYEQLESLLRRLGFEVRCEPFDPRIFGDLTVHGGLCRLRGEHVVVLDSRSPLVDRVAVLAGVLAGFDLEGMFMPPQVRLVIEKRTIPANSDRGPAQVISLDQARKRRG